LSAWPGAFEKLRQVAEDARRIAARNRIAFAPTHSLAVEACLRAIERIEEVVDQETLVLGRNKTADLTEFSRRKSHGLLDLTRGLRGLDSQSLTRAIEPRLRALRIKLTENSAALRRHLDAVQEVSSILSRAIRDSESDGTYSNAIRFNGRKA
jgi:hypothetical protein